MKNFEDKVAYVTGGSSGIGLAVAAELVRRGARVAVIARDRAKLEAALSRLQPLRRAPSQRIAAEACDVSDAAAVRASVGRLVGEIGAPDLLVNTAGWAYIDYFANVTPELFQGMVATNLYGPFHMIAAALPHMKSRNATIVNVSSVGGIVGYFGASAYCATKFGLIGLSEALRNELAPEGIRVAVLCPPNTDTPGFERENLTKPYEAHAVEGTAGTYRPEQVARALMRGLAGRRFLIFCGFMSRLTDFVHRMAPRLVFSFMDSDVARARKKHPKETMR